MRGNGQFMGGRVLLTPRPARRRAPVLVAAMLGHLPGRTELPGAGARLDRLRPAARALMRAHGLGAALDHLQPGLTPQQRPQLPAAEVARLQALYHLPIPLAASAELDDIFPEARAPIGTERPSGHFSLLAGDGAWLPQAVDDFFANGGERLWIVRIPPEEGRAGFLGGAPTATPATAAADDTRPCAELGAPGPLSLLDPLALRGIATLLPIPEIALIAAPDLERMLIPARRPDIARKRLANPAPAFVPCGVSLDDDHRERRRESELPERVAAGPTEQPDATEPACSMAIIERIAALLARWRPDCQYLHSLPLGVLDQGSLPVPHPEVLVRLSAARGTRAGAALRRVQLLWPYLRGPRFALTSPVGVVAGRIGAVARAEGPWRSVAGRALMTDAAPWPRVSEQQAQVLREAPGVGVLMQRRGRIELDDERLVVPALHPDDWLPAWTLDGNGNGTGNGNGSETGDGPRSDAAAGQRAGEVVRFIGFLLRRLQALGERLIFDVDARDPRPRLLLDELCRGLHAAGALRGALPEEGYRLHPGPAAPGVVTWAIELAPAFPIDRLRLSFVNRDGEWQAGLLRERIGAGVLNG